GKDIEFNPSPDSKIKTGDILLVLGDKNAVNQFENIYLGASS
ncbi:unnamed protein product, partial [marine sediment metagenome]